LLEGGVIKPVNDPHVEVPYESDIPFDEGLLSKRLEDVELPSVISLIGRPEYDPGVGNIGVVDDEGGALLSTLFFNLSN